MPGVLPLGIDWPVDNRLRPDDIERSFHAYVHIPFCEVRCGYCDFNTYTQDEIGSVSKASFHEALIREIRFSKALLAESGFSDRALSSVFIGGGTPSLMAAGQISEILSVLGAEFGYANDVEITMEANPESLQLEALDPLRTAGVNRISMGAQSFDPKVLQVLDRKHDPAKIAPLVRALKQAGFRVSLDLIYGAPGETLESWQRTLEQALELETEHISSYSLIVEDGTKLQRQIRSGELAPVDEDLNASKYELASASFEAAGLEMYEFSNFGEVSRHNLAYWQSQDWWGYGPGAHSHLAGSRFWNRKHPTAYLAALSTGSPAQGMEQLNERQQLEEQLMLGLRTKWGVERSLFNRLGVAKEKVAQQIGLGMLEFDGSQIRLTKAGRLLADRLVLDFLT